MEEHLARSVAWTWAKRRADVFGWGTVLDLNGGLYYKDDARLPLAQWRLRQKTVRARPLPDGYPDPWRDEPEPVAPLPPPVLTRWQRIQVWWRRWWT